MGNMRGITCAVKPEKTGDENGLRRTQRTLQGRSDAHSAAIRGQVPQGAAEVESVARGWPSAGCGLFGGVGDDVKREWHVEKWDGDQYLGRTPHAMTKWEAETLAKTAPTMFGNERFVFKVVLENEKSPKKGLDPNSGEE